MRIDNAFEVPMGIDDVWVALVDIERIAPCLPGASIDENRGGGEFGGSMRIKLGPVSSTFKGTLKVAETDDENHRVVIDASARDTRGQGGAAAIITSTLVADGDRTRVEVQTDMKLAGTAAQFGRGVVNDVSEKMMAEFAVRLADEVQHPAERAAAPGAGAVDPAAASSEAASSAAAPSASGSASGAPRPRARAEEDEVFDLTSVGRDALIKRAVPIVAGVAGLVALVAVARRGGTPTTARAPRRAGRNLTTPTFVFEGPLVVVQTRPRRVSKES